MSQTHSSGAVTVPPYMLQLLLQLYLFDDQRAVFRLFSCSNNKTPIDRPPPALDKALPPIIKTDFLSIEPTHRPLRQIYPGNSSYAVQCLSAVRPAWTAPSPPSSPQPAAAVAAITSANVNKAAEGSKRQNSQVSRASMSSSVESYRICCRCATVDLPDYIISDVRPSSDCHSVLDGFLRHFNIVMSQSDLDVVVLIFSGRRLDIKATVGTVFGSVPVRTLSLCNVSLQAAILMPLCRTLVSM
jgi:hypothetical protein